MEDLFKNLRNDYTLATESYGKSEFIYYFRNIRPAIEWLCKLVIADQLDGKCKPSDIFDGTKTVRRSGGDYIIQSGTHREIKGRQLTETMLSSFLYNRKDIRENRLDEQLKGLKESMEMYSSCLRRLYSVASASSHSSTPTNEIKHNATKYASILSDFISFLIVNKILNENNNARLSTLKLIQIVDAEEVASIESEKKLISEQYLKQKQELETALIQIEEFKRQQEEMIRSSEESISEKDKRIKELEDEIEKKKAVSSVEIHSRSLTIPKKRSNSDLDLADDMIDYDQEDIILAAEEESLLVCGCAGSGKSVIAMKKARQLHERGIDVITIAYTKSLNNYMKSGIPSEIGRFYYHHQWKKAGSPSADYIIVDEIQDFTPDEVKEFVRASRKHYFFFGDSAQSIYAPFKKDVMSMEQISGLTKLEPMMLFTNYRLPRSVAKITQGYVGVNVEPYSERRYVNNSTILPSIVKYEDRESQVIAIAEVIEASKDKSIGIFLPDNSMVLEFCKQLSSLDVPFEFKYELQRASGKKRGYEPYNTLDFTNILPKVMTYHSAKGLQFDVVILPWFNGATSDDERKALYVAMTRTKNQLLITYYDVLCSPLNNVPEVLYKQSL